MSTGDIVVYSATWCLDFIRAKKFYGEQRLPAVNVDIEAAGDVRSGSTKQAASAAGEGASAALIPRDYLQHVA